jgi:hypothetical protein
MYILTKVWKEKEMKYKKPEMIALSSQASMWCSVGSNGEMADNGCINGNTPTTTGCWKGGANTTGHCIAGTTVKNLNPVAETYCNTGGSGHRDNPCLNGSGATGDTGACKVGTLACHCWTGSKA